MSWTPLEVPALQKRNKFIDHRIAIPGNSETWAWRQELSKFKFIAIHHTAGPKNQHPDDIARYHINSRKWGGIGYHFLIGPDGMVWYVGDIATVRAHVGGMNDLALGISMIGDFTTEHPTKEQLLSAHQLCSHFVNDDTRFSGITGWECVKKHRDFVNIAPQFGSKSEATACPGNSVGAWWDQIIRGVIEVEPNPFENLYDEIEKIAITKAKQIPELWKVIASLPGSEIIKHLFDYAVGRVEVSKTVEKLEKDIIAKQKDYEKKLALSEEKNTKLQSNLKTAQEKIEKLNDTLLDADEEKQKALNDQDLALKTTFDLERKEIEKKYNKQLEKLGEELKACQETTGAITKFIEFLKSIFTKKEN